MSPTEIKITLAEALGAKWYKGKSGWEWLVLGDPKKYVSSECPIIDRPSGSAPVSYCAPDFPEDLNAAKDAAVRLCDTSSKRALFNTELNILCGEKEACATDFYFANNTASALDICTALLKALGLWKEGE